VAAAVSDENEKRRRTEATEVCINTGRFLAQWLPSPTEQSYA